MTVILVRYERASLTFSGLLRPDSFGRDTAPMLAVAKMYVILECWVQDQIPKDIPKLNSVSDLSLPKYFK